MPSYSPGGPAPYAAFVSYSHAVDGKFAPALQRGLERFAKPWYRRRAIRVFRDQASLSANPGLWSSLEHAMGRSQFFVLLASRQAAASIWVNREVEFWCQRRRTDRFLIALTDGEIRWDDVANDFDWARSTALPKALMGTFFEEPRFIDFRWARDHHHISLANPQFREHVAERYEQKLWIRDLVKDVAYLPA